MNEKHEEKNELNIFYEIRYMRVNIETIISRTINEKSI
jgi:hypothetical protein